MQRLGPDLPAEQREEVLHEIYRQAKILERVCLEPKIMHPAESDLRPTPSVVDRTNA